MANPLSSSIFDMERTAMELTSTLMSDRQRRYRETYRERVAGWYN
jgi:hypothetical protein